jgi:hypothetical protein
MKESVVEWCNIVFYQYVNQKFSVDVIMGIQQKMCRYEL